MYFREIEHQIKDAKTDELNGDEFLDSPITQQLPKCCCRCSSTTITTENSNEQDEAQLANESNHANNSVDKLESASSSS